LVTARPFGPMVRTQQPRKPVYRVQLEGADAEHTVENVSFENVTILGQPVTRGTQGVSIGKNVENVRFDGKP